MAFGLIALIAVAILIVFGVAHRVLDKLRLNDMAALIFVLAMIVGTFLPNIPLGFGLSINIGGGIVPIILAIYLFVKAETTTERSRAIIASFIAGGAVYLVGRLFPSEPETMPIDPMYIYGIMAGLIAYILGRSRRSAFIAGIMGIILADVAQGITNLAMGMTVPLSIGGAGMFDAVVISGLLAVLLAELVGETREKLQGGTDKKYMGYENGHFTTVNRTGHDDMEVSSEISPNCSTTSTDDEKNRNELSNNRANGVSKPLPGTDGKVVEIYPGASNITVVPIDDGEAIPAGETVSETDGDTDEHWGDEDDKR